MFDVSFVSAAQVDRFGNLNITVIGEHDQPKVRLVGCLAQPELYAFVRRPIIVVDLDRRTFVEQVDFRDQLRSQERRCRARRTGSPRPRARRAVFTDKAVFDFSESEGEMRLVSLHPGVDDRRGAGQHGISSSYPRDDARKPRRRPRIRCA